MAKKGRIMTEIDAMKELAEVLGHVAEDARPRMISWLSAKYNIRSLPQVQFTPAPQAKPLPMTPALKFVTLPLSKPVIVHEAKSKPEKIGPAKEIIELKDIGKKDKKDVKLAVKDIKARDIKDAAFRIAYLY